MPKYVHTWVQGDVLAQERVPVSCVAHAQHGTEQTWVDLVHGMSVDLLIADTFNRCKCYGASERLLGFS